MCTVVLGKLVSDDGCVLALAASCSASNTSFTGLSGSSTVYAAGTGLHAEGSC